MADNYVTKTPNFSSSEDTKTFVGSNIKNVEPVYKVNDICLPKEPLVLNNVTSTKKTKTNRTYTTKKTTQTKKRGYQYSFQKARTDKRVSLNVSPLGSTESFAQRVQYVLGLRKTVLTKGQTVYGFLYSCLSKSCGLIFPYTPNISISHSVNYDSTDITHSNLRLLHYKNTPPPTYQLEATFTADTRENALHMLSALWFLRAVTKCDFGERGNTPNTNNVAGMPPPILYLNGYDQIMDNIPVVVKSFSYSLPKDKDYVSLGINLDSSAMAYSDRKLYSDVNGQFYDNYDGNASGSEGMKYLNGIANSIKELQSEATSMVSNRYNNYYFNNWLPTEMIFSIQLEVQPNMLKNKKQFDLNYYKMGIYNLDAFKGGVKINIPTSNGDTADCTNQMISDGLRLTIEEQYLKTYDKKVDEIDKTLSASSIGMIRDTITKQHNGEGWFVSDDQRKKFVKDDDMYGIYETVSEVVTETKDIHISQDIVDKVNSGIDTQSLTTKKYKFDKSGFTW